MAAAGEAVATGLVASLARPGGNVTGSTFFSPELMAKRLDLIRDVLPRMTRVAVLANPGNPTVVTDLSEIKAAAKAMRVALPQFGARAPEDFASVFAAMIKKRVDALVIQDDAMLQTNTAALAVLASRHRLPASGRAEFAEAGGLIGYGANIPALSRRAAHFIDKIFKGAKAGDLPVERATTFELVVNSKTAKALGLKIPNSVLVRATRVIE
jgi:putative ABC transport system substrate-binding protein